MSEPMRVLVLGASGNFGGRIVRALRGDARMALTGASRSGAPVPGADDVPSVVLDLHARDFAARLAALRPQLVIHCVGPFQGQDYRVAQAALAAGAHYLDLADGRAFVAGFAAANHAQALAAGRFACSGASTLPALSSAVVDALSVDLAAIDAVETCIAPGQRAVRGAATLAAVLSYLGRPVAVLEEGIWRQRSGWMDLRRVQLDFGRRWAALCDVPDLVLLPQRYPALRSARFHAALEVGMQHFALWMLAALRRLGLPLPVERWAGTLDHMAGIFDRLGGQWGGMCVQVRGRTVDGTATARTWQLRAPAVDGPEIPCMAAVLLARRLASGEALPAGAFPCMGFLRLDEFAPEFSRWRITTAVVEQALPA